MSAELGRQLPRIALTTAMAVPLVLASLVPSNAARAAPDPRHDRPNVSAEQAAAIAEERLPLCTTIRAELYYDGHAPMWFVETECSDETWKDLRIDALSGRVVAING